MSRATRTVAVAIVLCAALTVLAGLALANGFQEPLGGTCGGPAGSAACTVGWERIDTSPPVAPNKTDWEQFVSNSPTIGIEVRNSGDLPNVPGGCPNAPVQVQWWAAPAKPVPGQPGVVAPIAFGPSPNGSWPGGIKLADFGAIPAHHSVTRTFSTGPHRANLVGVVTYTAPRVQCVSVGMFGVASCGVSLEAHAQREDNPVAEVTARITIARPTSCARRTVEATVEGHFVHLRAAGSTLEGSIRLRGADVCVTRLVARAHDGRLTTASTFAVPDSTPNFSTAHAIRTSRGVDVTLLLRNILPESHCGRPTVSVDGQLLRLKVDGSVARATRELIPASAAGCAPFIRIEYRQSRVTAQGVRSVTGTTVPLCKPGPPP